MKIDIILKKWCRVVVRKLKSVLEPEGSEGLVRHVGLSWEWSTEADMEIRLKRVFAFHQTCL